MHGLRVVPVLTAELGRRLEPVIALARRWQGPARAALLIAVIGLLVWDMHAAGWRQIVANLPSNPLFYLIFIINYSGLPLFEAIIYHLLWRTGPGALPMLIKKRVYNEAVIDYSGETALFVWARAHTGRSAAQIMGDIRDVNVLSALTGNVVTCAIIVAVIGLQANHIGQHDAQLLRHGALFTGGSVVVLGVLAALLRKWLLALPVGQALAIAALHGVRLGSFLALQALQWHVAVPAVGWPVWLTFLALQMAISRLPLVPGKDLLFAGLAISLGARLALAPGVVGGLFVAASGLNLAAHAVMYLIAHLIGPAPAAPQPD